MTSHVARLYSLALALFVFFLIVGDDRSAPVGGERDPEGSTVDGPRRPRAAPSA